MHSSRLPLRYLESLRGIQLASIWEGMCHFSTLRTLLCKRGFLANAGQDAEASVTVWVWQTLKNIIWESHLTDRPQQLCLKSYAHFPLVVTEERNGICGAGSGGSPTVRWGCSEPREAGNGPAPLRATAPLCGKQTNAKAVRSWRRGWEGGCDCCQHTNSMLRWERHPWMEPQGIDPTFAVDTQQEGELFANWNKRGWKIITQKFLT